MTPSDPESAMRYTVVEPTAVPWPGLLLGYAAMVPIVVGAVAAWVLPHGMALTAERLALVWAGAIVAFLAGVRRGLSFRAPDGATAPQIVTMLWLFGLAVLALALGDRPAATGLLLVGYASLAVFDTRAAWREEAPPYFAKLRPMQMMLPILSLVAIGLHQFGYTSLR